MRKLLLTTLLFAACTDSGTTAIEIPFDLFASDELSTSSTGVCTITPVTQAGGVYKESGLLELNPALNPNAEYVLGLQIENYLSQQVLTDPNGNTLQGSNANDLTMNYAVVTFKDQQYHELNDADSISPLKGSGPAEETVLISGVVRTGGLQSAASVSVVAVSGNETVPWGSTFLTDGNLGPNSSTTVILDVQIFGTLGSGEGASSGHFEFPLQVCYGCGGIKLRDADGGFVPDCPNGTTPLAIGHGPCCAPQDFFVSCIACGSTAEACCGAACGSGLACTGSAPQGVEVCDAIPDQESATCVTGT